MKLTSKRKNVIYIVLFILYVLFLILGKYLTPYDPNEVDMANLFASFSSTHLLGTDNLGRDIFSRILAGGQTSIFTSVMVILISLVIGVMLGLISGYFGGPVDWVIMRLVDTCMVFPSTIIAIIVSGILGGGTWNVIISISVVKWFQYCRVTRSIIVGEKGKEYVMSAKLNGMHSVSILVKHMLPYVVSNVMTLAVVDIGRVVLTVASLSYLGFGIQLPNAEWGLMLNEGRQYFTTHPVMIVVPGLAIFVSVMIFNFFGNRLQQMVDIENREE